MTGNDSGEVGFQSFSAAKWSSFAVQPGSALTAAQCAALAGVNEPVSMEQVTQFYLPLAQYILLNYHNYQSIRSDIAGFVDSPLRPAPFVVGIAGSVAVGKSTLARVLQALLTALSQHPVDLVTTDGFLYPMAELESRDLMPRKGFPESYDVDSLLQFLMHLKAGKTGLTVPVYSHHHYDILPGCLQVINQPAILLIEGLNILQPAASWRASCAAVSDYLDFSLYVDAATVDIERWFLARVEAFCAGPFLQEDAYFHFLTRMSPEEVRKYAERVWREINQLNLEENILPCRGRAHCIVRKGAEHEVSSVWLRQS